jgi:transcriptional regulator of arginine metabolism
MTKRDRHAQILEILRTNRVTSQEALRELLHRQGTEVTQATLSRDIRELRLVKVPGADGAGRSSRFCPRSS